MAVVSVNRETRTIWIDGEIDNQMVAGRLAIRDLATAHANKTITLMINSPGGSAYGMFAVMEEMDLARVDLRVRFNGLAEGIAMSAGLILLQHCDERRMGRWTTLMAHGVSYGVRGDLHDHDTEMLLTRRMTQRIADLFGRRTHKPSEWWFMEFWSKRPLYYDAEQALEIGLVDHIIGSPVTDETDPRR